MSTPGTGNGISNTNGTSGFFSVLRDVVSGAAQTYEASRPIWDRESRRAIEQSIQQPTLPTYQGPTALPTTASQEQNKTDTGAIVMIVAVIALVLLLK